MVKCDFNPLSFIFAILVLKLTFVVTFKKKKKKNLLKRINNDINCILYFCVIKKKNLIFFTIKILFLIVNQSYERTNSDQKKKKTLRDQKDNLPNLMGVIYIIA